MAIYLDPDIRLFAPLDFLWAAGSASLTLTPHILTPLPPDGKQPADLTILRAGLYNLGFAALRNTPQSLGLLEWWDEQLHSMCLEDVREGVIVSRIAAHAADIAKGVKGAMDWDNEMARRRKALDWKGQIELSLNPERARKLRESSMPKESDVCSMCGEFCSMKGVSKYLKK